MLQARYSGDETTVHRILTEYREHRCRRRPRTDVQPENLPGKTEQTTKRRRRRSLTASRQDEGYCGFPQVRELLSLSFLQLGVTEVTCCGGHRLGNCTSLGSQMMTVEHSVECLAGETGQQKHCKETCPRATLSVTYPT
jgi:hypothetical protein